MSTGLRNSSSASSSSSTQRTPALLPLHTDRSGSGHHASGTDMMAESPRSMHSGVCCYPYYPANKASQFTYKIPHQTSGAFSPTSPYSDDYDYGIGDSEEEEYRYSGYHEHRQFNPPSHSSTMDSTASTVRPLLRRENDLSESKRMEKSRTTRAETAAETPRRRETNKKKKNANSYCGRHGDEFLFGGRGLSDLIRAVIPRKD